MKMTGRVTRFSTITCAATLIASGVLVAPAAAAATTANTAFTPVLAFHTCPPKTKPSGVRCAKLTVPLDWRTPEDGRTTTINVRIMRSAEGKGGLTFNPGGPGGSGIEAFPSFYSLLPDEVVSQFDFVGWDPRGVGGSGPKITGCEVPEPYPPLTGPVDWKAFWQESADSLAVSNAACMAANPDAAPFVGTWQVIRDLDALRAALGYSAWNYWGMSYGTRIGHAYASTFPSRLRTLVMDGSVMANETVYRFGTSFPANYWMSLQMFPALAAPSSARKMTVINEHLDGTVLALPDGTEFTRWDFAEQLRFLLTSQSQYPAARALINNLYAGITASTADERAAGLEVVAAIAASVRMIVDESKKSTPVQVLVNCSDFHDRPTVDQLAIASEPVSRNFGSTLPAFMGNSAACFGLSPEGLSPALAHGSPMISLATPPLFVLSSGDAATPWVWGRSLANTFVGSRTITYDGTQHVAYLFVPSRCVNEPVTRYLLTRTLPSGNLACSYSPGGPSPLR
ncbi:MAG: alpha/beta fold hydrolase [Candidatus Nanopelagicales bacterium]